MHDDVLLYIYIFTVVIYIYTYLYTWTSYMYTYVYRDPDVPRFSLRIRNPWGQNAPRTWKGKWGKDRHGVVVGRLF